MTTINRELLAGSWRSWLDKRPKRVGPYWLQLLWTLLLCMLIALGFTIVGFAFYGGGDGAWRNLPGWGYYYGLNLKITLIVGAVCHLLFEMGPRVIGFRRLAAFGVWQRALYYVGTALLGVGVAWPITIAVTEHGNAHVRVLSDPNAIAASVLISLFLSGILFVFFETKRRQIEAEQRATEAQLRLLQGQIEPHFLFNTLANVQALIDVDAPKAKAMLEAFTDYLRGSLGSLRGAHRTLGEEAAMAESYLLLLQTRMEDRLAFSIEIDPAL
ncbi:MAG: histidine kinase, partial [Pseudomonadota bacterium]|nr:histidine kinase [Pseudomonadota bacterium]